MPRNNPPPRERFRDKLKLWVWNSCNTFMAPIILLYYLGFNLAVIFPARIFILISGIIGGLLGSIPFLPGSFLEGLMYGTFIGSIVSFIPTFIVTAISTAVFSLAIMLTAGLVGAAVGLLTSFGLAFKNPHSFWLRKATESREEDQAIKADAREASAEQDDIKRIAIRLNSISHNTFRTADVNRVVARVVLHDYETPPVCYLRFATFDPNQGLTSVENPRQRNPVIDLTNITVVKASNGKYYNRAELDQAHQNDRLLGIRYNPDLHIVNPELKHQFKENEMECPISSERLTRENAVRSRYGHYYHKDAIKTALDISPRCPMTRYFLNNTPRYFQAINRPIILEPAPATQSYFMKFFARRSVARNVVVPQNTNSSSLTC